MNSHHPTLQRTALNTHDDADRIVSASVRYDQNDDLGHDTAKEILDILREHEKTIKK